MARIRSRRSHVLNCLALAALGAIVCSVARAGEPVAPSMLGKVTLLRVPNGGIQPQTMVDEKGVVHLIYLAGEPRSCDVFYVRSHDGENFSQPLRVNSESASAIAIGNIRGAHLALGASGRVHVAWMG